MPKRSSSKKIIKEKRISLADTIDLMSIAELGAVTGLREFLYFVDCKTNLNISEKDAKKIIEEHEKKIKGEFYDDEFNKCAVDILIKAINYKLEGEEFKVGDEKSDEEDEEDEEDVEDVEDEEDEEDEEDNSKGKQPSKKTKK